MPVVFRFGSYRIDTEAFEILHNGQRINVEPRVLELIAYLAANSDRVVTKDDLIGAVWGGRIVSDAAVSSQIAAARRTLGDDGKAQSVIRTYPRKGFRFVAEPSNQEPAVSADPEQVVARPAIAVLPFANLSGDASDSFVGEGIAEDLTTALSSVRLYRVISRNSTAQFKDRKPDLAELSRELGAAFVLSGNYQRAGDRLRISVQLEDVSSETQIWARRFDREYREIFDIQDEVVDAIVGQLEPELDRVGYSRLKGTPAEKLTVWELYHRAMILVAERKIDTTRQARELFERATALDPSFARGHAAITQVYAHIAVTTGEGVDGVDMLRSARKAVTEDAGDYWSQTALGIALLFSKELPGSLKAHERAVELNPHNAQTRAWYAESLISAGKAAAAIPQLELAIRLSPGDPWIGPFYGRLSRAHYYIGDIEPALAAAESSFHYDHAWPVHACYTACLMRQGRDNEMRQAFEGLLAKQPGISAAFIRERLPEWHGPYVNSLVNDLTKAGLPKG